MPAHAVRSRGQDGRGMERMTVCLRGDGERPGRG
jgi:hypothetical protein